MAQEASRSNFNLRAPAFLHFERTPSNYGMRILRAAGVKLSETETCIFGYHPALLGKGIHVALAWAVLLGIPEGFRPIPPALALD